jgi:ribA/ribD-fused uncharacterized protein
MSSPIVSARNVEDLIAALATGERPKWLFFWGHTPAKDGSITKSCFSQWWNASFVVGEVTYPTAEHFMMAEKARLFGDEDVRAKILAAPHPRDAKMLGRHVANFDDESWNRARFEIVVEGNLAKFSQNEILKAYLLNTQDRVLVEASPVDSIWGIGLGSDSPDAESPDRWRGLNLLGFALMEVRAQLLMEAAGS